MTNAQEMSIMTQSESAGPYMSRAMQLVRDRISFDQSDPAPPAFDVYVVWFSKTLQNWKALVSTTLPDLKYYEVTYNGEKRETYIDTYLKVGNVAVPDPAASCGAVGQAPNGDRLDCTLAAGHDAEEHFDGTRDNMYWRDGETARV